MESFNKNAKTQKGIRQHTFVFKPEDMELQGNAVLENFCGRHTVISILFSGCADRLVYVLIYRN